LKKAKTLILVAGFFFFQITWSQTVMIQGQIKSTNEVENIHVINKSERKFTITNSKGEFKISAKVNDTLVVSSIQNKLKTLVVEIEHVLTKKILISLEEQINQLDEVVVGKILSGNLLKDMNNIEGEAVTANSLGIPSYQGRLLTQSERKLKEASDFQSTIGFGGSVGIIPIINAITGRTKALKNNVKLERKESLMYQIKARLSDGLFVDNPLDENYIMDYFYFVSDDKDFTTICAYKSDLEILVFLKEKLIQYKSNQELKHN
jgi:hypothetical protein